MSIFTDLQAQFQRRNNAVNMIAAYCVIEEPLSSWLVDDQVDWAPPHVTRLSQEERVSQQKKLFASPNESSGCNTASSAPARRSVHPEGILPGLRQRHTGTVFEQARVGRPDIAGPSLQPTEDMAMTHMATLLDACDTERAFHLHHSVMHAPTRWNLSGSMILPTKCAISIPNSVEIALSLSQLEKQQALEELAKCGNQTRTLGRPVPYPVGVEAGEGRGASANPLDHLRMVGRILLMGGI